MSSWSFPRKKGEQYKEVVGNMNLNNNRTRNLIDSLNLIIDIVPGFEDEEKEQWKKPFDIIEAQ